MSRLLTLFACLVATGALAAKPRIAVMDFSGPKASKVKAQLSKKLCASFTCIKPKKGAHLAVDAVVTGEVTTSEVELKVYTDEETEPVTKTLALGSGAKLGKKALADAPKAVKEALQALENQDSSDDSSGVGAQP